MLSENSQSECITLVVGPTEGRTPASLNSVGEDVLVKLAGRDTRDQFAFFHLDAPPMSGPLLHQHTREDEMFYVLEGELVFEVDGKRFLAKTGTTVFAPRNTVHACQNFTNAHARLLIVVTPAGVDRLFEEMSAATPVGSLPDMAFLAGVLEKHGLRAIGPPLS